MTPEEILARGAATELMGNKGWAIGQVQDGDCIEWVAERPEIVDPDGVIANRIWELVQLVQADNSRIAINFDA